MDCFQPVTDNLNEQGYNLLTASLTAASTAYADCGGDASAVAGQQWIPYEQQTPVQESEKIWDMGDGLFLGSCFGAQHDHIFDPDILGVSCVVNITSGSEKVPNVYKESGVQYVNYEVHDQPGETAMEAVIAENYSVLKQWLDNKQRVLVHCRAGLSRSVTLVVAYLMRRHDLSLKTAIDFVQFRRGRKLQINPSFWMLLAKLERELHALPPHTIPSYDFTPWWVEGFSCMGFEAKHIQYCLVDVGDWINFPAAFDALLLTG